MMSLGPPNTWGGGLAANQVLTSIQSTGGGLQEDSHCGQMGWRQLEAMLPMPRISVRDWSSVHTWPPAPLLSNKHFRSDRIF